MAAAEYELSVFLNCPIDAAFKTIFEAIVFAFHDCGYLVRCAIEADDGSQVRIDKIARIIEACRFGIHDISRTEPDPITGLPRFNMPLELGMFLGAKRFGRAGQRSKICLILDTDPYRFHRFVSDIAGQDISTHGGDPLEAIKAVRNWFSHATPKGVRRPGGAAMVKRYQVFRKFLPRACAKLRLLESELTFPDFVVLVEEWLKLNPSMSS